MDSINSFKGYGKVDPAEEQAYRRKTRKRIIIVVVSAVLLVGLIVGVVAGTVAHRKNKSGGSGGDSPGSPASVEALCSVTEYKESCMKSMSPVAGGKGEDPLKLFVLSLKIAAESLTKLASRPARWMKGTKDKNLRQAFDVCREVFDDAVDRLNDSIASTEVNGVDDGKLLSSSRIADLKTWLSAAITDQETCLDALDDMKANGTVVDNVKGAMKNSTEFVSNSLAIASEFTVQSFIRGDEWLSGKVTYELTL
nr:pectinesterase 3 [Ipomoea batatas]